MSFADFMIAFPGWARLLLAVAITVGLSLIAVRVFHERMLHFDDANREAAEAADAAAEAAEAAGEPPPPRYAKPPETFYLAQRVLGLTATAFVFLLAFTLGNFWGNANDARSATLDEATSLARALSAAQQIPAANGGEQLVAAFARYAATVTDIEWPLMQAADGDAAYAVQAKAAGEVGAAILAAQQAGAAESPTWGLLTDSANDMTDDGTQRIAQVPSAFAPAILWGIAILAVTNLALSAAFQPARLGPNLVLIGIMAAITAMLLFVVVEASNPYVGGGAVLPAFPVSP